MPNTNETKQLEDGKLLLYLKRRFLQLQTRDALLPVLNCLRDSIVIVPIQITLSPEDHEKLMAADGSMPVKFSQKTPFKPDILQNDGRSYFPIFSNPAQLPPEYAEQFSTIELPVLQCIEMANRIGNLDGLVLDAFTEPMLIHNEAAKLIPKFKSHLRANESAE